MVKPAAGPHRKKMTPLGIIFTVAGVLLFIYFVRKAGVEQILSGIKNLGFGFLLIIAISSIRLFARSLSWVLSFEGRERLRFWDAVRGRLMGDALGNILGFANFVVSEPAKPAMIRDRVPLLAGLSAITIENVFYTISVCLFVFSGAAALLIKFQLSEPLRIGGIVTLAFIPLVVVFLYLFIRRQYRFISQTLRFLHRRGMSDKWIEKGREIEDRIYGFYQRKSSRFIPIMLLESCFHVAGVLEVYMTLSFISLGQKPTLFAAFILESVNRIINLAFKFITLRMGVDEAATGEVAGKLQFTVATGVTLAVIRKARDVFWTIVGVVLLVQRGMSLRAAARGTNEAMTSGAETENSVPGAHANEI